MKVGITILKLSPTGKAGKRSGNLGAVCAEAGPERAGRDPDIDRSRTHLNEYVGYQSTGIGLAKQFEAEAREYSEASVAAGGRKLRSDAKIGFAAIVKPPAEWIETLSPQEREKFFRDSDEIMYDLMGHDSQGRSNIRATALHRDEVGEHKHYFGMPYTADGRLCAKDVINLKLFSRFNREYPERMQAKGWDIESCAVYDPDAVKGMTEEQAAEYKAARIADKKRSKGGRTSAEYKAEERLKAINREIDEKIELGCKLDVENDRKKALSLQLEEQVSGSLFSQLGKARQRVKDKEQKAAEEELAAVQEQLEAAKVQLEETRTQQADAQAAALKAQGEAQEASQTASEARKAVRECRDTLKGIESSLTASEASEQGRRDVAVGQWLREQQPELYSKVLRQSGYQLGLLERMELAKQEAARRAAELDGHRRSSPDAPNADRRQDYSQLER